MATYVLKYAGKQYRSQKAEQFAINLALQLRGHHSSGVSAYRLSRYYTIDSLKEAVSAVRNGRTLEVEKDICW